MLALVMVVGMMVALAAAPARADSLSSSGSPSPDSLFTIEEDFVTGTGNTTDLRFLPDGRLVIVNKQGSVFVRPAGGGALVPAGSFDVDDDSEKGLLGVAVHPQFATNHRLFFYYSANGAPSSNKHRVVMRTLGDDNHLAAGETPLLQNLRGPANHDGGGLDVGPDGKLYVSVGDTGCNSSTYAEPPYTPTNFYGTCLSDDPNNNGAGNGKILRINLDGTIPADNPLVGVGNVTACGDSCGSAIASDMIGPPRTDLFAWGFRNPFRFWVDQQTGRVWVGDVGEISYEEVTIVQKGRHHGWPWREGVHGFPATQCHLVRVGTGPGDVPIADGDCVDPVYSCSHGAMQLDQTLDQDCTAITGGQIVDTCTWPAPFRGRYFFGDSSTGDLWTLTPNAGRDGIIGGREDFGHINGAPVAIHTGSDGALYIAVLPDRVVRIAPIAPLPCTGGCMDATACDDADPCTADTCNVPASLCEHTPLEPCGVTTTTTTTLPGTGGCQLGGREGARCLCGTTVTECGPGVVPASVDRKVAKACQLADRSDVAPTSRRMRRLLRKAVNSCRRAAAKLNRLGARVDPACGGPLAGHTQAICDGLQQALDAIPRRK